MKITATANGAHYRNINFKKVEIEVTDLIGWIGVVAYVIAYAFLSLGWMHANGANYHLLNGLGGLCLIITAYHINDIPNVAVNFIWIIIAMASLLKIFKDRKHS